MIRRPPRSTLFPYTDALPISHFVIVWSRHGRWLQVMDPATGRRWPTGKRFLSELYVHQRPVPAAAWREWAGGEESQAALTARLDRLGVGGRRRKRLIDEADAEPGWTRLAALDAATRMVQSIVDGGGLDDAHEVRGLQAGPTHEGAVDVGLGHERCHVADLDAAADWERDNPDEHTWIWLPETDTVADKKQGGNAFDTLRSGQHPINGTLEAKPGVLTLTTNSVERSQRGQGVLEALLHGLVGPALSALQTPEQLMAENENQQQGDGNPESTDTIDPEIAAEIIRYTRDQHYRQSLDEAIPALDNKTPRQCARSKKGREKVIEWLKHLENSELRRAASQGQEPYDSSWMWVELKLDKHRNSQP